MTCLGLGNWARRNDVGGHPTRAVFNGNRIGQRVNAGLGNRHMGLERHATVVQSGTDEDDPAAGASGERLY